MKLKKLNKNQLKNIACDPVNANWYSLSGNYQLSEGFIARYEAYVRWDHISAFQNLSEAFIVAHRDQVNWMNISGFQRLSEQFIINNLTMLDLNIIKDRYPKIYDKYHLRLYQHLITEC